MRSKFHRLEQETFALELVNPQVPEVLGDFSLPGREEHKPSDFSPSHSSGVPLISAQQLQNASQPFYLHTSNADPHCPDNFQMLLNEVFQFGNATALQSERRNIENQLHFNLLFTLIQWL